MKCGFAFCLYHFSQSTNNFEFFKMKPFRLLWKPFRSHFSCPEDLVGFISSIPGQKRIKFVYREFSEIIDPICFEMTDDHVDNHHEMLRLISTAMMAFSLHGRDNKIMYIIVNQDTPAANSRKINHWHSSIHAFIITKNCCQRLTEEQTFHVNCLV